MVEVTLLAAPGSPIACSQLRDLALDVRVRPGSVGVGVSASVGSLRLLDLSTPWPQLRLVCRAGRRLADESAVEEAGQDGRGAPECDALTLSAETEPLHSSCALLLDVRLAGVRILVNPNLVTSIAAFAAVPPSHWAAVLAIEHSTRRVAASAAAASASTTHGSSLGSGGADFFFFLLSSPMSRAARPTGGSLAESGGADGASLSRMGTKVSPKPRK